MTDALADPPRLTLEQFLEFDDGTDTLYELRDGRLHALPPPRPTRGAIMARISSIWLTNASDHRCGSPIITPGIVFDPEKPDCYVPDIAFSAEQLEDARYLREPIAIAEVLSPTTVRDDFGLKLVRYQGLPSMREIWLVDSRERWVQVHTLVEARWVPSVPVTGAGTLRSALFGEVELATIYLGSGVPEKLPRPRRPQPE